VIVFRLVRRVVGLLLLAAVLVVGITGFRVWQVARDDDRPRSEAIVVLGAAQFDGRPSSVFEARLEHARALYDDEVAPRVLTVGGNQDGDRFTEAAAGARYLREAGVPAAALLPVEQGNDTLTSVRAVAEVMREQGWDSAVLVTDPAHSLRARRMARDAGIDAVTSPARAGPAVRTRESQARYVARETAAYLYYRVFGRSSDRGPDAL